MIPPALSAQTALRGQVVEVDGYRVRIEIESERPPRVGDPVTLEQEVSGLGNVAIAGDWRVTGIDEYGEIWVDPYALAPRPKAGYRVEVKVGGRTTPPGDGNSLSPSFELSWDDGSGPEVEADACRGTPYAGGYRVTHTGEVQEPCRVVIPEVGRVGPGFRIAVTASHGSATNDDEPYGIAVGLADADATDYLLFVLTPGGRYAAARWGQEEGVLVQPTLHPMIRKGPVVTNRIAIEIADTEVHMFVNGIYMGPVEVAVPEGFLALTAGFEGLNVVFDDLTVAPVAR